MDFGIKALFLADVFWLWFSILTEPVVTVALEPTFDSPIANVTVKEMTTAVLPCSVKYLGKHMVIWTDQFSTLLTFEDRRIIDDERLSVERPFIKNWNLHIRNVKHKDQGMYNCQINTNPVKIKVVHLSVKVPAKILNNSSSDNIKVREGDTVTLQCNVSGIPVPTVTWHRLIRDEKGEAKKKIGMSGEVLIIHNISRHCGDVYECSASNGVPPAVSRFITVSVQFPPEINLPNARMGQIMGKETILECQITANPQAGGTWTKNGVEMKTLSGKYRVEMYPEDMLTVTVSLRIVFIEREDYGIYKCEASNQLGEASGTMELYEYERPKVRTTTTTSTTTTTIPPNLLPPMPKPDVNYPLRRQHNRHQQHRQHSRHGSNSVVVKDKHNIHYDPKDRRFQSSYNEGGAQESLSNRNRSAPITTASSIMATISLAFIAIKMF